MVKLATSTNTSCYSFPRSIIWGSFAAFQLQDPKTRGWFKNKRYKPNNFATVFVDFAKYDEDKIDPTPSWSPLARDESCLYSNHQP